MNMFPLSLTCLPTQYLSSMSSLRASPSPTPCRAFYRLMDQSSLRLYPLYSFTTFHLPFTTYLLSPILPLPLYSFTSLPLYFPQALSFTTSCPYISNLHSQASNLPLRPYLFPLSSLPLHYSIHTTHIHVPQPICQYLKQPCRPKTLNFLSPIAISGNNISTLSRSLAFSLGLF